MNTFDAGLVLTTKLQRPNLPGDFIPRQNLLEFVNTNLQRPLTLVSAGAGFGKSTFVSGWFNEIDTKNCWLSLDENDNDLRIFLIHLISAIKTVVPDFGKKTSDLVGIPNLPGINILKNTLINDLNELSETVILALDDFHVINNRNIFSILSECLKFPPKNFHLVIISRTDPSLPLSRLRAANKMKEIRSAHLKLTQPEIEKFIENHPEIKNTEKVTKLLYSNLDGWFTGLRFVILRLSFLDVEKENLEDIHIISSHSDAYFIDEVLGRLDGDLLNFLLKTSVLHKFNNSLADYLLQSDNSYTFINKLVNNNLFIVNLDSRGEWFRYHHVFHTLLQKELKKRLSEDEIFSLKTRAVKWFEEQGMINEAIILASQAGNLKTMVSLIEKYMHHPLNKDKWYVLEQWLEKIPERYFDQSPTLLIAQMWVLQHKNIFWQIPELLKKFNQLQEKQKPAKDDELQALYFKGVILFWAGKVEESMLLFKTVLDNLSQELIGAYSLASIYYGTSAQQNGVAGPVYRETEKILHRRRLHPTYKFLLLGKLMYIKVLDGDLSMVKQLAKKQFQTSLPLNDLFGLAWVNYFRGYIAFQNFNLKKAETYFEQAIDNVYYLNMTAPMDSFAGLLITQKMLNKQQEYRDTYDKMISFVNDKAHPVYSSLSYSIRARLALLENDLEAAGKWMKNVDLSFDSGNVLFDIEVPRLTECRVLLANNDSEKHKEALSKLQKHRELAERTNNIPFLINTLVLLSIAYAKLQESEHAKEVLTLALTKAQKGNWKFAFIEAGKDISPILDLLASENNLTAFIHSILKAISNHTISQNKNRKKENILQEHYLTPLTNRELDVLELMAKRLSNKEIAAALFISPGTVKRHIINVFQKLDVHKRQEAVSKARLLGILSA
jgi:LuxR family maltose regulon positive regulatory protein